VPSMTNYPIVPPEPNEAFALLNGSALVIGNRTIGDRSFVGTIAYVALYAAALSGDEVAQNAAVLLASDDAP